MDPHILEATLKLHIKEMRERLERAAGIAQAAQTCAEAGNLDKAIEIALDVEQLIYEVNTFLNAASMMHRLGIERPIIPPPRQRRWPPRGLGRDGNGPSQPSGGSRDHQQSSNRSGNPGGRSWPAPR